MRTRGLFIASLLVAAGLASLGWFAAAGLPPGAELPIHWNATGEVDRTAPAYKALALAPGLTVLIAVLFAAVPLLEPLQERLAGSAAVLRTTWIGTLAVMIIMQLMIAGPALGLSLDSRILMAAVGLMLIAVGNTLPKSRPSFFVGARTPWALTNPDNWVATQRLAGKTMVSAGALILVGSMLPLAPSALTVLVVASALAAAFVPIVYSWWLWRKGKAASG